MTPVYGLRRTIAGLAAVGILLAVPAAWAAFLPLPANGSQVNDDLANAIAPNQDAGVSDVVGGAITAGEVPVPWATFEAFAPSDVQTLAASDPTSSSATLHGSVDPGGTSVRVHFDFGETATFSSSTTPETLGASVVPTVFDAVASGLANGSTIHYRAVAASDFATVAGADATATIVNLPPVVSIGQLDAVTHLRDLGRPPMLSLPLDVDEPATVTIELLNRNQKVVRQTTVTRSSAGAFVAPLSVRHLHGNFTLHVFAVDPEGAMSAPVELTLRIRR
ncbi:MAG: hypothetical protein E6J77_05695 [Deltaproteobacteria bacterium]|nr:MAG: hypothetical protein E6J77_05695 [Deltaproteobacteria bacterium]